MTVKITYFVHGTTTDNKQGLATGWLPGELSELGIIQSKELRNLASHTTFDLVICSDLKRAVDSADLVFAGDYLILQDARLRECNYGELNGSPESFKQDMALFVHKPFLSGESYEDVERRMRDFCQFLKKNYDNKHIALVAHQAPQLALDVILTWKTREQAIDEDRRKTKSRQPWWQYMIE